MARVHIINVSPGDCTLIQHNSGRVTGIDICGGNLEVRQQAAALEARASTMITEVSRLGNYRMCERPSNPINYIKKYRIGRLFRFILSHPDMDHMDGLVALQEEVGFLNFWDSGARRAAPDFDGFFQFKKEDWGLYEKIIAKRAAGVHTAKRIAGDNFAYANKSEAEGSSGDGLFILAPSEDLLCDPDENDDVNEASYVIEYLSGGNRMIFPGDAHDASWEYVMRNHAKSKGQCSFMLAPHHGRHSDRSYDFLDFYRPRLTVLGCSPSKYIDYDQWRRRNLEILTSNQAGNIVLEIHNGYYDVFIENEEFARDHGGDVARCSKEGFHFYKSVYS